MSIIQHKTSTVDHAILFRCYAQERSIDGRCLSNNEQYYRRSATT